MWKYKFAVVSLFLVGTAFCVPQGRVVNGCDSYINKYPFMASLRKPTGSHSCGCTIIAPNWVLTAAHCVNVPYARNQTIQYGQTDIAVEGPNVVAIKRVIMHPEYVQSQFFKNDIALIELVEKLVYNYETIAPVELPEKDFEISQLPEGEPGVLTGWGLNGTFGVQQTTLQEVKLKIYSDKECQERHKTRKLNNDRICAGVDVGIKGACRSDSGGPLIYNGSIQLGIVSFGEIDCATNADVFTKVSHYVHWIHAIIR